MYELLSREVSGHVLALPRACACVRAWCVRGCVGGWVCGLVWVWVCGRIKYIYIYIIICIEVGVLEPTQTHA